MEHHHHAPTKKHRFNSGQKVVWMIAVAGIVGLLIYITNFYSPAATPDVDAMNPITYSRAQVVETVDIPEDPDAPMGTYYGSQQGIKIKLLTTKEVVEIGVTETSMGETKLAVGDIVVVSAIPRVDGSTLYALVDTYRMNALALVLLLFVILLAICASWWGLSSLVGLAFSIMVLIGFVVPQILSGNNPLLISVIGSFIIAILSLYLSHGFSRRITVALIGTLITILLAVGLAYLFVTMAALTGVGTEEAFYLGMGGGGAGLNLRGLLLGGIVIGALGVLDDITTAQSAVVEELADANPKLSVGELYAKGFSVGREHIVALVNTLALAYVGAALPLLLLFATGGRPLWVILNSQMIAEEVVRTLVGSSALILAVPITTWIAANVFVGRKHSVGSIKI